MVFLFPNRDLRTSLSGAGRSFPDAGYGLQFFISIGGTVNSQSLTHSLTLGRLPVPVFDGNILAAICYSASLVWLFSAHNLHKRAGG